jgi:hypothetical protein
MNLEGKEDFGEDLKIGDVVWIKGVIDQLPNKYGDVKVRYFARPNYEEYARPSVNPIFLRRSKLNWLRRLFKFIKSNLQR